MTPTTPARFELHWAPRSRAARILWLMEESGAPYELVPYDLQAGTHKAPSYLALNPHGKVPTLVDRAAPGSAAPVVINESAAICAYVADMLPQSGLAPAVGTAARGAYYQWLIYSVAALEPAFADVAFARQTEPPRSALGWPAFADVMARLEASLATGPYLLGDAFSTADIMIGSSLAWFVSWGKATAGPNVARYLELLLARPAKLRANEIEHARVAR
ncbi:MAG: glutathione S-transferase family protein [Myxococcales bacterium]|nr:glutathione S-transferase family protein [Myxococcales bacterium]